MPYEVYNNFRHSLLKAKAYASEKNVAWAPPPGLLSSVLVHTVYNVIVQRN